MVAFIWNSFGNAQVAHSLILCFRIAMSSTETSFTWQTRLRPRCPALVPPAWRDLSLPPGQGKNHPRHLPWSSTMVPKNTLCIWYDRDALEAATFYAATFPDSTVGAVHRAPGDFPSGKQGDILTVDFTVV